MERLVLNHDRCPGDIVTMTALVRDIALTFPGRFQISVDTPAKDIWKHNPYVQPREKEKPVRWVRLTYGEGIKQASKECVHFLTAWHTNFAHQTGIKVPLTLPKPDLHLSPEERETRLVAGRYWVILSGGKHDFTTKHYVYGRHQQVVDALRAMNIPVVQAGAADRGHYHPRLNGALDLVGKTTLREFMRLIAQSEGVICTITAAMHIAAAFDKPCVVTGGGREEWWWEGYTNAVSNFGPVASGKVKVEHRYLHTLGLLDCCKTKGCWKNKTSTDEQDGRKSYCRRPVRVETGQRVPECMAMIQTEHIVEAVHSYYRDGILPPIGPAPTIILPDGTKVGALRKSLPVLQSSPNNQPQNGCSSPELAAQPISIELLVKQPGEKLDPTAFLAPPPQSVLAPPPVLTGPTEGERKKVAAPTPVRIVYDHERIGGRFTIFSLLYGDYFDMHKRHLDAILKTCPPERVELRLGSNQLGMRSADYVRGLEREGRVRLHYAHTTNERKYPVMRKMFHDPEHPIDTKWLVWFDDDSMCDKNQDWLALLAQQIVNYPDMDMFGPVRFYRLSELQPQWVREAPWFKGRPFRDKSGKPQPNGDKTHFVVGAFWALRTEAMRKADIPCRRLGHNGGDWTIGEQLYQAGFKQKNWTGSKEIVEWSAVPRRGLSESHPGKRK